MLPARSGLKTKRGPAGWPSLSWLSCLVGLVAVVRLRLVGVVRVRVDVDRARQGRLPLPRLAVDRGRRVARVARAVAGRRLLNDRVDRQAGEVDVQRAPTVDVGDADGCDGFGRGDADRQHVDRGAR